MIPPHPTSGPFKGIFIAILFTFALLGIAVAIANTIARFTS